MLIFQIKRIISSEICFNYFVTVFLKQAKTLGRSDDAKRRKEKDSLIFFFSTIKKCFHFGMYLHASRAKA